MHSRRMHTQTNTHAYLICREWIKKPWYWNSNLFHLKKTRSAVTNQSLTRWSTVRIFFRALFLWRRTVTHTRHTALMYFRYTFADASVSKKKYINHTYVTDNDTCSCLHIIHIWHNTYKCCKLTDKCCLFRGAPFCSNICPLQSKNSHSTYTHTHTHTQTQTHTHIYTRSPHSNCHNKTHTLSHTHTHTTHTHTHIRSPHSYCHIKKYDGLTGTKKAGHVLLPKKI